MAESYEGVIVYRNVSCISDQNVVDFHQIKYCLDSSEVCMMLKKLYEVFQEWMNNFALGSWARNNFSLLFIS